MEETINMDAIDIIRRQQRNTQACISHLVVAQAGLENLHHEVAKELDVIIRRLENECEGMIAVVQSMSRFTLPPPSSEDYSQKK